MNFRNEIYKTPFVVVLDHVTSSIVVAIRGSMSLKDALTDICAIHDKNFHAEMGVKVKFGKNLEKVWRKFEKDLMKIYLKISNNFNFSLNSNEKFDY